MMQRTELVIFISLYIVFFGSFMVPIYGTDGERPVHDDNKRRSNFNWDDENKVKLLKIFYETEPNERGHDKRIKSRWDELHGMRTSQSGHNLYIQAMRWIEKGETGTARLLPQKSSQYRDWKLLGKNIKWTPQMKEDILRFFYESDPNKWKHSKRMKELWDKAYPDHPQVSAHHLMLQARYLRMKREKASEIKKKFLTMEENEELLRCYYKALNKKGSIAKTMRYLFIESHPQFADASDDLLYVKVSNFRKKHPEIDQKISTEVSASINHSWEPGEMSGSKREESTYIPTSQGHNTPRLSEQYFNPIRDDAWIDRMIGESSLLDFYTGPDEGTNYQITHEGHTLDHTGWKSGRYNSNEGQRRSSKGKQPAMD